MSQTKARRGRGPAVHEALQRIPNQRRAVPIPNRAWHAPGEELFQCGPLDGRKSTFRIIESSSSDEDYMPDIGNYISFIFSCFEFVAKTQDEGMTK